MMFSDFLDDILARFGITGEKPASLPGVTPARDRAAFTSIFLADAARQQSELMFFNQGLRPRVVIATNKDLLR